MNKKRALTEKEYREIAFQIWLARRLIQRAGITMDITSRTYSVRILRVEGRIEVLRDELDSAFIGTFPNAKSLGVYNPGAMYDLHPDIVDALIAQGVL